MHQHMFLSLRQMGKGMMFLVLFALLVACGESTSSISRQSSEDPAHIHRIFPVSEGPSMVRQSSLPMATPTNGAHEAIHFRGTVRDITSKQITATMPGNQILTMRITAQTDHSHYHGGFPTKGQLIKIETVTNSAGHFLATKLEPSEANDPAKQNIVEFWGTTTSAVGSDRVIHFKVGSKRWSIPLRADTDLRDFGAHAQAIQANQLIEMRVQFNGKTGTILKVEKAHDDHHDDEDYEDET